MLHLTTLGEFRCTFDGLPTDLPRQRVRCAFLILLACERHVTRERAAALLWPESDAKSARHALSQTLYELRRSFGNDWVLVRANVISATDRLTIDACLFEQAAYTRKLAEARRLYRGTFLNGYTTGRDAWANWVVAKREELATLHESIVQPSRRTLPLPVSHSTRVFAPVVLKAVRFTRKSRLPRPVPRTGPTRFRSAMAAAVAFVTLVLHASTPGLMPAAIMVPDSTRYAVLPFVSDMHRSEADEQDRIARALAGSGLDPAIVPASSVGAAATDPAAAQRAARAVAAGRMITGRLAHNGTSIHITAAAVESFGAGREISRASVTLRAGADADSAFVLLVGKLMTQR